MASSKESRRQEVAKDHKIVLPNPMYGDWEKAIVENRKNLTQEETKKMKIRALSEGKIEE
ncbi:hypothetical protein [Brevibacillus panacihumi]|nr:hypothetical protein [Brevibacillus panacihumi]